MDEEDFGTENRDFLHSELLEVTGSDNSLPDLEAAFISDPADIDFEPDMQVTTFIEL